MITGSLGALGIVALIELSRLVMAALDPARLEALAAEMVAIGRVASASGLAWFSARLALEGAVGVILFVAALLLLRNSDRLGTNLGILGLVLSLTTVNLLVFFYDQFATIITAGVQFLNLVILLYFRNKFVLPESAEKES